MRPRRAGTPASVAGRRRENGRPKAACVSSQPMWKDGTKPLREGADHLREQPDHPVAGPPGPDDVNITATIEQQIQIIHRVRNFGGKGQGRQEFPSKRRK
ncbi:U7 snRNA-associated Sm-like protein LSm10 isoform X2 [Nannospalax galili]|uniref:U7 snRNA-associated Sm-like protein LSm10 isoform X2 n=1 Tax=Nannospalax galili TaxID=1026970 RepID=UPI00111BE454|nr:U7 snRNA-associated Sm-like protein LSm10 isoform X2 [Nannospalax galili]